MFLCKIICPSIYKENEKLKKIVELDFLTKLKNRYAYRLYIENLFSKNKKNKNDIFYVFLDLDNFKKINDKLGHSVGDEVLKKIANILTRNIRDNDRVFRLAGDEFIIFFSRIDKEILRERLVILKQEIEKVYPENITGGVSFGVYKIDFQKDTIFSVLDKADHLMYESKHQGGNKIIFWDEVKKENE